jgi:hypothetical protein
MECLPTLLALDTGHLRQLVAAPRASRGRAERRPECSLDRFSYPERKLLAAASKTCP